MSGARLNLELGFLDLAEAESFGFLLNVEPQIKASKNVDIGFRIGVTANSLTFENYDSTQFDINEESSNGVISIVPNFQYTWNEVKFRPSVSVGIGSYLLAGFLDVYQLDQPSPYQNPLEIDVNYQIGLMLRTKIELGKSIVALEYNLVPKGDIQTSDNQMVGKVDLGYLGLTFGYTLGAWKNDGQR